MTELHFLLLSSTHMYNVIYITFLIQSSGGAHLGWFHILTMVSRVAINVVKQASHWWREFMPFEHTPVVWYCCTKCSSISSCPLCPSGCPHLHPRHCKFPHPHQHPLVSVSWITSILTTWWAGSRLASSSTLSSWCVALKGSLGLRLGPGTGTAVMD